MPDHNAPAVYVEEVSFTPKRIEAVDTTITAFAGPTRFGPVHRASPRLGSLTEFGSLYGDGADLFWASGARLNHLWHATRAFFGEGGKQLHIARIFRPLAGPDGTPESARYAPPPPTAELDVAKPVGGLYRQDGHARQRLGTAVDGILLRARFPGQMGNLRLRLELRFQPDALGVSPQGNTLQGLRPGSLVWLGDRITPEPGRLLIAIPTVDGGNWSFSSSGLPGQVDAWLNPPPLGATPAPLVKPRFQVIRPAELSLSIDGPGTPVMTWTGLSLLPGAADNLLNLFAPGLGSQRPLELLPTASALTPGLLVSLLFSFDPRSLVIPAFGTISVVLTLEGGNDGQAPTADDYQGQNDNSLVSGLSALAELGDVSLVAAPGSSDPVPPGSQTPLAVAQLLIQHAETLRYRVALVDSTRAQSMGELRSMRSGLNSSRAALYYPWVTISNPANSQPLQLPPSGFIAGVCVRNDLERSVAKAPANIPITLAINFEKALTKADQETLNPEGINCLRFFEGRGFLVWGARVLNSDPEWKYINVRRYFICLERSIDLGTQWAVFEPNGPALWVRLIESIRDFLYEEWRQGRLMGTKPEEAYFVKCDRSTMTQADIDAGRVVCQVGAAAIRPAEFVIFRIGQWTVNRSP